MTHSTCYKGNRSRAMKYLVQQIHITNMTYSRFERSDAVSFEVVIVSLRHRFGQQNYSEDFHKILKDPGSIRKWTRRVISRAQFSEHVNIISQKVSVKWADIAWSQSFALSSECIMFSAWMRLSFFSLCPSKDKVLGPKRKKQMGSLVPVEITKRESHWQSQLVFFLHNFSHHSLLILDHLEQICLGATTQCKQLLSTNQIGWLNILSLYILNGN